MLADRPEWDGARQHELVVTLVVGERRQPKRLSVEQLCVGAGHPGRRLAQSLPVEIDPECGKEVRGGSLRRFQVDARIVVRSQQCRSRQPHGAGGHRGIGGSAGESRVIFASWCFCPSRFA